MPLQDKFDKNNQLKDEQNFYSEHTGPFDELFITL